MYQIVPFKELKPGMYRIFVGRIQYYLGDFVSLHNTAKFKNIVATFPHGYVKLYQDQFFGNTCIYHRIISKEEMLTAYRNAFEKRAVNQIISYLLHHTFLWY